MLCPEVWSFPIPDHNHQYERGIINSKNENKLRNKIKSHYFNKMVRSDFNKIVTF